MAGLDFSSPGHTWLTRLALGGGAVILVVVLATRWQAAREDSKLRDDSFAPCVARVGSEMDCRDRFDRNHEDCARLTRTYPSRTTGAKAHTNPEAYLDCVVHGPDGWIELNRLKRIEGEKSQQNDLSPR